MLYAALLGSTACLAAFSILLVPVIQRAVRCESLEDS